MTRSGHSRVQIVIKLDGGMSVTTITGQQLSITGPLRSYDLVNILEIRRNSVYQI